MRFSTAVIFVALTAATSGFAKAHKHHKHKSQSHNMHKSGGDATYYTPGLGSCGHNNGATDFIVAVDHATIGSFPGAGANPNANPMCGRKMRVTYKKKSIIVTVADTCPGCAVGSLDLTPTAFKKLAPLSVGRLHGIKWTLL